jgi:hypothetical protein
VADVLSPGRPTIPGGGAPRHVHVITPFPTPPRRTGREVLPHPAHRRPSPAVFDFSRHPQLGLGATTVPDRLISPNAFGEP